MPYWAAGNRITGERLAGFDLTEWTDYTPEWSGSTGATSIGNGTLAGRYIRAGGLILVRAYLQVGTTSTTGTGAYGLSLPFPAAAIPPQAMAGWLVDASASGGRIPMTVLASGGLVRFLNDPAGSFGVSSNSPFTWAAGDELCFAGIYEPA